MERSVTNGGVRLALEEAGDGEPAIVCLHGLTATRRYVLMGSRQLERSGRRVVLLDARGHGRSTPGPFGYAELTSDLGAVLDELEIGRAVLVGVSMGAHTALRFALEHPSRVSALALITPAFDPQHHPSGLERWDALARGLRDGGIEGFLAAYDLDAIPQAWRVASETALRQRLAAHEHLDSVADALEAIPRSAPFATIEQLAALRSPTLVVGSRDEADPGHPLSTARAYARRIPHARLLVEDGGKSPIAWQGGRLSAAIAELDG